jgi:aquaporin Z
MGNERQHAVTRLQCLGAELVGTFLVTLTATSAKIWRLVIPYALGVSVATCGFLGGPISDASMNPARSIAPQILGGEPGISWIYAAGPILGAAIAVGVHHLLCGEPTPSEREAAQGSARDR